ncbi:hypothetical protein BY458DRAFT_553263 [Sporodiniella umbellata]|nr:hypothetical protein BY458DRAFT_553263 [Sporodiniella umbellata]
MALANILKKFIVREADISKESWYLAASCSIAYANHPKDIVCLYKVISDHITELKNKTQQEKNQLLAKTVLRIQDAGIKSFPLIGFPKSSSAIMQLGDILPDSIKALLPDKPIRGSHDLGAVTSYRKIGQEYFNKIYDDTTKSSMLSMRKAYPDLEQTCMQHAYPVYAEFSILDQKDTSVVILSSNMIQNAISHYKVHKQGLYNNGATKQEVDKITSVITEIGNHYNLKVPA